MTILRTKILFTLFLSLTILLVLLIVLPPKLIRLDLVKSEVTTRLNKTLASDVKINDIRWRWHPFPYISLIGATIDNKYMQITMPVIDLSPNWQDLFHKQLTFNKITFDNPLFKIKRLELPPIKKVDIILPETKIIIYNGSVNLPAGKLSCTKTREVFFTSLNSTIKLTADQIEVNLLTYASFAESIVMTGSFKTTDNSYQLNLDGKELQLHKAVVSLADGRIIPTASMVSLYGKISGRNVDTFSAELTGNLPEVIVKSQNNQTLLTPGFANVSFNRKEQEAALVITELVLLKPALALRGKVKRSLTSQGEKWWDINLNANNLNLTEIRESTLALWGEHHLVKTVSDIVLDGKAVSTAYQFRGKSSDFKKLEAMTITAAVENASIYVPGKAALHLTETSGEVTIKNSRLHGKNLSARLNNSLGSNGSLLVGLNKDDNSLKLEIDIAADLADLPPLLHRLVPCPSFQQELSKISQLSGSSVGRLIIGENRHDIKVYLIEHEIYARAYYERVTGLINITNGRLTVVPDKISWQEVTGGIGQHVINEFTGNLLLRDDNLINITSFTAALDSRALYLELMNYPVISDKISEILSAADGTLLVKHGTIQGPLWSPVYWQYNINLIFSELLVTSPRLSSTFTLKNTEAQVSSQQIKIIKSEIFIHEQSLALTGNFYHTLFAAWQGWVAVDGVVRESLAEWVKSKQWVPPKFFPQIPSLVQNLKLSWDMEHTAITGIIIAGTGEEELPRAHLDLIFSISDPLQVDLLIINQDEQVKLSLNMLDNIPETFSLDWQGRVSASTLNKLLEDNSLLSGYLDGNFRINFSSEPEKSFFEGLLAGNGVRWHWYNNRFTDIKTVDLHGLGSRLKINRLELVFPAEEETTVIKGMVATRNEGLNLDLDLASDLLSQKTVQDFVTDLKTFQKNIASQGTTPSKTTEITWNIDGRINFNLNEFQTTKGIFTRKIQGSILAPLTGQLNLYPHGEMSIYVTETKTCYLGASGAWYSDNTLGQSYLTIKTTQAATPLVQDVLQCLGIKQDIIEGEFKVNVALHGTHDQWQSGKVMIHSSTGRILRLTLLSRVLSVVNLTDLFAGNGFAEMDEEGFPYSDLILTARIDNNELLLDQAIIRGKGLNLFGQGRMNLKNLEVDGTIMVAPLKTLDTLIARVPLVGRAIGGKNGALFTIPVGVTGDIRDPAVILLSPDAIGDTIINLITNILLLPFRILSPILPGEN